MPKLRKVSGAWREVTERYRKVAGQWRPVKESYKKIDGVWMKVYQSLPTHITAFFENSTTGTASVKWHKDEGFLRIYMSGAVVDGTTAKCGIRISNIPADTRVILNMASYETSSPYIFFRGEYNNAPHMNEQNSYARRDFYFSNLTTDFLLYVFFDRFTTEVSEGYIDVYGLRFENDIIF